MKKAWKIIVVLLLSLFLMSSCVLTNDTTKVLNGYIVTRYEIEEGGCDIALKTYNSGMNKQSGLAGFFECWLLEYPNYIIIGDIDIFSVDK